MNSRSSGILLHISSLPSDFGVGDLGDAAYAFADFLKASGQTHWQILPINPTDGINGHSPYSCFSAFAGNALFISPTALVRDGFLLPKDITHHPVFNTQYVDFTAVTAYKEKIFTLAFERFSKRQDKKEYDSFCAQHSWWLDDFALFIVIKTKYQGRCWQDWPSTLRNRNRGALLKFKKDHAASLERIKFIQFLFFKQWAQFKEHVSGCGISIIGDIPIYVNYDSVEVWCFPRYFKLTAKGELKFISGCPPDYFSKTGQRWGNPVYDWAVLRKSKYDWWQRRITHNLQLFDYLRIDHFRGFLSFWQIPAHEKLAVFGRWVKGPGTDFFKVLTKQFKTLPLIAEDLGEITPDVPALMKRFGLPGMRVLLFGFGGDPKTNPHLPANYSKNCVVYSGTHDNNTIQGWYSQEANPQEKNNLAGLVGRPIPSGKNLNWALIRILMDSKANVVILPLPDVLGLGAQARMNTPATKVNNWKWRFEAKQLSPAVAARLRKETRRGKR